MRYMCNNFFLMENLSEGKKSIYKFSLFCIFLNIIFSRNIFYLCDNRPLKSEHFHSNITKLCFKKTEILSSSKRNDILLIKKLFYK